MCGIAVVVTPGGEVSTDILTRMTMALRHRGPDSQGVHAFTRCGLGSARLSIVDVEGGLQPILSADGKTGVTFNGAIYGFRELKKDLREYPFRTGTDTEVILAMYAKYGDGFLRHLPGMFAFALWDERRQLLTCARDRFGEKPFYYAWGRGGEFLGASEIGAILASGLVEPKLDPEAVSHYLTRLHVHPLQSIYSNIHVLPPAHALRLHKGQIRLERYWQPPEVREDIGMGEAVERFRELLEGAVRKQLVADVPVGVLLSGGVDSGTVAAIASKMQPHVRTFSFGFRAGVENELPFARGMAARYQTTHYEVVDDKADIPALLRRMQTIYDEPLGDSSCIPTFLICEQARKHVTVALGGDGADELLGGYLYWSRYLLREQDEVPEVAETKSAMQRLAAWFRGAGPEQAQGSPLARRYATRFRYCFSAEERRALGVGADAERLIDFGRYQRNSVDDWLRFDTDMYLPGDILVKTDRAAMANSLELRAPFLDMDLAEFCMSLPHRLKVNDEQEKLVLREACGDLWTPEIRNRAKQGFGGPMAEWLGAPAMAELKREMLGNRNGRIFGVLDFDAVQGYVEKDNQQTWSLLVLALWMEEQACRRLAKS